MSTNSANIHEAFEGLSFTKREINILESVLHKFTAKKGTLILKASEIADQIYYTCEGCLRAFHINNQGKEHTIQFAIKGWWITDFTAFFSTSQALLNIEVLQDATLFKLSAKDRDYIMAIIPKIQTFTRLKLELAYTSLQKRVLSNLSQTATERYIEFMELHTDIEKIVKNYHIASYLGITTESLSRIRKELASS